MNKKTISTVFKAVGLAMGVATLVLSIMKKIDTNTAITLLSIGLIGIGIGQFGDES